MNRTPESFTLNSTAAIYGPENGPSKSGPSPRRSFVEAVRNALAAGMAVAVTVAIMTSSVQAQPIPPQPDLARLTISRIQESNRNLALQAADVLTQKGNEVCFTVREVKIGGRHERQYQGDLTKASMVVASDCEELGRLRAGLADEVNHGGPLEPDIYAMLSDKLKGYTYEGATRRQGADNDRLVQESLAPMPSR